MLPFFTSFLYSILVNTPPYISLASTLLSTCHLKVHGMFVKRILNVNHVHFRIPKRTTPVRVQTRLNVHAGSRVRCHVEERSCLRLTRRIARNVNSSHATRARAYT